MTDEVREGVVAGDQRREGAAKSKWQTEFDALPEWVQKMVRSLSGYAGYGWGTPDSLDEEKQADYTRFEVILKNDKEDGFSEGFFEMRRLSDALSAPWPPPTDLPPHEQMTTQSLVEMVADADDSAFDQPCYFGHRVECHAVYCHNDKWPDSPRKCRRSEFDPEYRHEDCPGFVPNKVSHIAKSND